MQDNDPHDHKYRTFYQTISKHYHATRYQTLYGSLFRKLHKNTLIRLLQDAPRSAALLEIACGTGHTTTTLVELGFQPIATDLTPEMFRHAQQNANNACLFVESNAFQLPFPDNSFDIVVSTRFMHLFNEANQIRLLREINRVIKPGGKVLTDFDNKFSRWILAIPFLVYNVLRYRRFAPDNNYNTMSSVKRVIDAAGFQLSELVGVGGTHLVVPAILSENLALWLGEKHNRGPLRRLAEQFVILAQKS